MEALNTSLRIDPSETQLVGKWLTNEERVLADETCNRIAQLTANYLVRLAQDQGGWDTLFRDPSDGRYWVLSYPQSHLQGGGPQSLLAVGENEAKQRFLMSEPT